MKKKDIIIVTLCAITALISPQCALANSSWHWLTNRTPLNVLPFAILVTILIEFCSIKRFNFIRNTVKVFLVVCFANLVSFLLPYAYILFPSLYTMEETIRHTPVYVIGFGYFVLTLAAEIPIAYNSLKEDARSRKVLFLTIILVNALTTYLVFLAERKISPGSW